MHDSVVIIRIKRLAHCLDRLYAEFLKGFQHLFVNHLHALHEGVVLIVFLDCVETALKIVQDFEHLLEHITRAHRIHCRFLFLAAFAEIVKLRHLTCDLILKLCNLFVPLVFFAAELSGFLTVFRLFFRFFFRLFSLFGTYFIICLFRFSFRTVFSGFFLNIFRLLGFCFFCGFFKDFFSLLFRSCFDLVFTFDSDHILFFLFVFLSCHLYPPLLQGYTPFLDLSSVLNILSSSDFKRVRDLSTCS